MRDLFQKDVYSNSSNLRLKVLPGYMLWPKVITGKVRTMSPLAIIILKKKFPLQLKNHGISGSSVDGGVTSNLLAGT